MTTPMPPADAAPAAATFPCPFPPGIRTLGLFTPAGIPRAAGLKIGCRRLRDWGLELVWGHSPERTRRALAGTDADRAREIHDLLQRPDVDALLAVRGGFGCARLLEHLDRDLLRARALPVVGYSDLTALHLYLYGAGLASGLSGPMVAVELGRQPQNAEEQEALAFTFRSLEEAWQPRREVALPRGVRLHVLKAGRAQGPLLPATLSVLTSLLGTPYMPDLGGALLVLEDVNEAVHRLDRYLTQLRQAGVLRRLAGLILGRFAQAEDAHWIPDLLTEVADHVPGPVVCGLPYGHALPLVTIPVGRIGTLEATADGLQTLAW